MFKVDALGLQQLADVLVGALMTIDEVLAGRGTVDLAGNCEVRILHQRVGVRVGLIIEDVREVHLDSGCLAILVQR